ncbi:MAG: P-loop NTPase family protein [Thermoplasmatota archaeon]
MNAPATALRPPRPPRTGPGALDPLLSTPGARRVHEGVTRALQAFAVTSYGRARLAELPILGRPADALASMAAIMADRDRAAKLDRDAVAAALKGLRPPAAPVPQRSMEVMAVCESEEIRSALAATGVEAWLDLAGPEALAQAHEEGLVLFLYEEGRSLPDLESLLEIPATAARHEMAPDSVLAWFKVNRRLLEICADLARLTGLPSHAPQAVAIVAAWEAKRPRADAAGLQAVAEELRRVAEEHIHEGAKRMSLRGDEVLGALGSRWPPPLRKLFDEAVAKARASFRERTGIDCDVLGPGFPVAVDDEAVEMAATQEEARRRVSSFQAAVKAAGQLAPLKPLLEGEIVRWLDFEVRFALGCFALDHGLRPAVLGDQIQFGASVHLHLASNPQAQRVAYQLGGAAPVAILTGANSGGKSTLLEHLAQLAIMVRLGLPVVGSGVVVPWVDEVHVVAGRRVLDAGALESLLRSLMPLARPGGRRLVLADEVEAVTEREAAARILAFLLDKVAQQGDLCVVVSHMAEAILERAQATIRTDGIEATGLDEKRRLVVDRSPRMGFVAKSTPELIVRRLALTARGPDRALFQELLASFGQAKGQSPKPASPTTCSVRPTSRP